MTDQAISPLRRRMIEDMSIRKFAPKTQHDYVQRVKEFAAFLGRSPDTAKSEDVRGFRLHLASCGGGAPKINATVSALRFFFNVTLDRADLAKHLTFMREPRKVPVVLSPEEVARFLEATPSIKYKAALSVAYGAGRRCARPSGWSTQSVRSAGPRRYSPICRATPTASPSPTVGWSPSTATASPSGGRIIAPRAVSGPR
jgi:site-specific recombinase XerC